MEGKKKKKKKPDLCRGAVWLTVRYERLERELSEAAPISLLTIQNPAHSSPETKPDLRGSTSSLRRPVGL